MKTTHTSSFPLSDRRKPRHSRGILATSISALLAPLCALSLTTPLLAATETFTFGLGGATIPDGNAAGLASAQTPLTGIDVITGLTVNLNLGSLAGDPAFNGDLYVYLRHVTPGGTGFSVLLNRVGTTASDRFGYGDAGFNVIFDDAAANGDIHLYQNVTGPISPLTGTWQPDARTADPNTLLAGSVTDASPRTAFLSSFNALSAKGEWTLFVADLSSGSTATINSWGMTINGLGGSFYWKGATSGAWNAFGSAANPNWTADAAGATPILAIPDALSNVIFSAASPGTRSTTLGQDFTIRSLTVDDTTPVSIGSGAGGPHTLTISGDAGTGIAVATGANLSVGANVTLAGASNTIAVNGTGVAALSGVVGGGNGLSKTGSGALTLSGINTYTGVTSVGAGTLSVATIGDGGVAGNLGQATSAAANLVFDGGTLQYTGASASSDRGFTVNPGKTATFDITANNLTITGAAAATTGALTKIGAGALTLTGANAYTGDTTVGLGKLSITQPYLADGSTVSVAAGADFNLDTGGASDSINVLYLGGLLVRPGLWGGLGSAAPNKSSLLTSTGMLNVATGAVILVPFGIYDGQNLSAQAFDGENGYRATLMGTNLNGSSLASTNLVSTNFNGATLVGVNLVAADLSGAILLGADLTGADLTNARLYAADLAGANLLNAKLNATPINAISAAQLQSAANVQGVNLSGNNLVGFNLGGLNLTGANLNATNLLNASLNGTNLSGATVAVANLQNADLRNGTVANAISAAQLNSAANIMGVNLSGNDLTSFDLTGKNLTLAKFIGCNLTSAVLVGSNLTGANLTAANLTLANLNGADLTGANFTGANLNGALLINPVVADAITAAQLRAAANITNVDVTGNNLAFFDLHGLNLSGANLSGTNLSSANLNGANINTAIFGGANLQNADLRNPTAVNAITNASLNAATTITGINLSGNNLSGFNLAVRNLTLAKFTGSNLSGGASLAGANLTSANFVGANLTGSANLTNANLTGANLANANLTGADLGGADLTGASFINTNLQNAILRNATPVNAITAYQLGSAANVTGVHLQGNNLSGFNLAGKNLSGANLDGTAGFDVTNVSNAYLVSTNLSGANLTSVNLTGANLENANLTGANLTNATVATKFLRTANFAGANLGGAALGNGALTDGFINDKQLDIAAGTTTLNTLGKADLGNLTTLNGGNLIAIHGFKIDAGTTLSGHGTMTSNNLLADAAIINGSVNSSGGPLVFTGYVKGTGTYSGDVTFAGTYAPGLSPAAVNLGSVTLQAASTVVMELGGLVAGAGAGYFGYDQINATALAAAGTLNVVLINGFAPLGGATFDLFNGALSGTFAAVNLPVLPAPLAWDTSLLSTDGIIKVTPPAAAVAPASFSAFAAGPGDFDIQSFDEGSGSSASFFAHNGLVSVIPEPSSALLLLGTALPLLLRRRRTAV